MLQAHTATATLELRLHAIYVADACEGAVAGVRDGPLGVVFRVRPGERLIRRVCYCNSFYIVHVILLITFRRERMTGAFAPGFDKQVHAQCRRDQLRIEIIVAGGVLGEALHHGAAARNDRHAARRLLNPLSFNELVEVAGLGEHVTVRVRACTSVVGQEESTSASQNDN